MWPLTMSKAVSLPLAETLLTCARLVAKSMTSGSAAVVSDERDGVGAFDRAR